MSNPPPLAGHLLVGNVGQVGIEHRRFLSLPSGFGFLPFQHLVVWHPWWRGIEWGMVWSVVMSTWDWVTFCRHIWRRSCLTNFGVCSREHLGVRTICDNNHAGWAGHIDLGLGYHVSQAIDWIRALNFGPGLRIQRLACSDQLLT